jgi:HAE1 family hydrophobic/amphiphilic exporter-1
MGQDTALDNSNFILASVHNLRNTVLWAGLFVFLVILFFLRDLWASIIVAVSIPTSLIITFVLMWLAGYTINQDTLASLAVAVGMVVDNAIVVVDNIHRHRQRGQKARESAIFGTNEVGVAVTASTLTTIAIFAPIMFVGGIAAIIFGQFAAIMTMALCVSLLTALMLVPMLCSKIFKAPARQARYKIMDFFYNWGESFLLTVETAYVKSLNFALGHRKTVLVSCLLLALTSLPVSRLISSEFFPQEDQNRLSTSYELPVGTRYERTGIVARKLQEIVDNHVPEKTDSFIRWGVFQGEGGGYMGFEETSNTGFMLVALRPKKERHTLPAQIIQRLRPLAESIPGAKVRFSSEDPLMSLIFGGGRELAIDIYDYNLNDARAYAQQITRVLTTVDGVTDIDISRKEEKPELKVVIDRDKASFLGLSVADVGGTIETFFAGTTATKYREAGDEYDILVRFRPQDRQKLEDLRDAFVTTPTGHNIPLANIARIEAGFGPTKVERKNQSRVLTITADVTGRKLGAVVRDIKEKLAGIVPPPGFDYGFAGAEQEKAKAFRLLLMAAALGMVLVYMVMASQFESLRDPFIIFLSIPFGIVGAIFALALTGQALSVMSFIALIMMVGIVVNNGIVLISYTGILRQRGLSVYDAIIQSGTTRLRPVLSTTITTILGLIPLALSRGEGSEVWVPFAVTIIGGLVVGTLLTLVFMPVLYSIFERMPSMASPRS